MVMSAVPVHAAGRISPEPASSTGVVVAAVPVARPSGIVDDAAVVGGPADGEGDAESGVGDSDAVDDDDVPPVIWISPTTTSTEASNATTRIPVTHRVLVVVRAAIQPVCASGPAPETDVAQSRCAAQRRGGSHSSTSESGRMVG